MHELNIVARVVNTYRLLDNRLREIIEKRVSDLSSWKVFGNL